MDLLERDYYLDQLLVLLRKAITGNGRTVRTGMLLLPPSFTQICKNVLLSK